MLSRRRLLGLALPGLALGLRADPLKALFQSQEGNKIFIWEHLGTKGGCGPWAFQMLEAGFTVTTEQVIHGTKLREEFDIPEDLWSCHTAVIEAYIIEGHVPPADIQRMLRDRPVIAGLCAPDFLDEDGYVREVGTAYDVIAFGRDGSRKVYATHRIEEADHHHH
jgi:hypothetical protein